MTKASLLNLSAVPSLACCISRPVVAQGTSDLQADRLAQAAYAALTGGSLVNDATLSGSVAWISGADHEKGTATLMVLQPERAGVDLQLPTNSQTEIRNDSSGVPAGFWIGANHASDRTVTFEAYSKLPKRVENYHHARHLLLNLLRIEGMLGQS